MTERNAHHGFKMAFIALLVAVLLVGCGKDDPASSSEPEPSTSSEASSSELYDMEEENSYTVDPEDEPPTEKTNYKRARLRTGVSDEYRDIDLVQNRKVDLPSRIGYTFLGYTDKSDGTGTRYIDENGKILRDDIVEDFVVLYPSYEANEYSIIICEDGVPLTDFNKIVCKYDQDVVKDLPMGREMKGSSGKNRVITGFTNADGDLIIKPTTSKKTLQKLASEAGGSDVFDHENKTVRLNIVTSDVSYQFHDYNQKTITTGGYIKQSLNHNEAVYDEIEMPDTVDFDALRSLGYKTAKISVTYIICTNNKDSARICIIADSKQPEKDKEIKKESLIQIEVDKDNFKQGSNTCTKTFTDIPLDDLEDVMRVYYNSEGILAKEWTLNSITVEVVFQK